MTFSQRGIVIGLGLFVAGFGLGHWRGVSSGPSFVEARFIAATSTGRVVGVGQSPRIPLAEDVEFQLFWNTWQTIKDKYYVKPVSDKELFYGALTGLAAGVRDPYTSFFPPREAEEFSDQLEGKFEGIGAQIEVKDARLQVVAPLDDSPAEKAGLRAGDIFATIDGKTTDGLTVDEAARRIRGPKGTPVTLTIVRPGSRNKPFSLTVIRDEIRLKSVKVRWFEGNIALVELTAFNTDTPALFEEASRDLLAKKAKGIILDMRNNPGGAVRTAQLVAGSWLGNEVIFHERRQGKIVQSIRGIGRGELANIKTLVLINEGSASAAEILAGALEDAGKAQTVGAKTFGKGSVQEYEELPDGSALKITVAEWLTPKERAINHTGLEPMIKVDRTEEDYDTKRDPQLDAARAFFREGRFPTATTSTSSGNP